MLQFMRSNYRNTAHSFSYIEAHTSLHPHLTLWENLKIESGHNLWVDFEKSLNPECLALLKRLSKIDNKAVESEDWEKFIVSTIKAIVNPSQHILIDMNEDILPAFLLKTFKSALMSVSLKKNIFLASFTPEVWKDCSHSLVTRNQFNFEISELDQVQINIIKAA